MPLETPSAKLGSPYRPALEALSNYFSIGQDSMSDSIISISSLTSLLSAERLHLCVAANPSPPIVSSHPWCEVEQIPSPQKQPDLQFSFRALWSHGGKAILRR
jgi:hypothetical protein